MGNPNGFIKHQRKVISLRPALKRLKDWKEITNSSQPDKHAK